MASVPLTCNAWVGTHDRADRIRHSLDDPEAEIDSWRTVTTDALTFSATALDSFRNGSEDDRRAILARMYANLLVTDRKVAPVLRFPYSLLDGERPDGDMGKGPSQNPPDPSKIWLSLRKKARPRDARERAFMDWCSGEDLNLQGLAPASTSS